MGYKAKKTKKQPKAISKKKAVTRRSSAGPLWPALRLGDTIDVVAPGFCPTDDEVEAGVRFLENWGLVPRLPHDLFGQDVIASNTDEKRLKHLSHALLAKDSTAVWCLRGGYGSIRLVPGLLKLKKPSHVKPILGISDITTLQLFVGQKWGWPSLQAPLLDRLGRTVSPEIARGRPVPIDSQVEELKRIVFGESREVLFEGLRCLNRRHDEKGPALIKGAMTGGNLLTFGSANGTALHPSTDGKIVYFEDIGERGYRVDRWLEQMVQSRIFTAKTKAIVFGEFIEGSEKDGSSRIHDVIERFAMTWAKQNKVVVFTGIASGHGQNQRVVPLGTSATIEMSSGSLRIGTGSR